jgi:hypothetical protein
MPYIPMIKEAITTTSFKYTLGIIDEQARIQPRIVRATYKYVLNFDELFVAIILIFK